MNARTAVLLARRAARKPPRVVARRVLDEIVVELERFRAPARGRRFGDDELLRQTGAESIDALWAAVLARPYPFVRSEGELQALEQRWPSERARVLAAADRALAHEIDLLGTGLVQLGSPIDWHRDWKTGRRWPRRYGRRIDYTELDRPSDVKVPWEISRAQWLLPAAQAYLFGAGECYAAGARTVLEDWLDGNPYALGVNWAIAMEPALRLFSWSYLLYACGRSDAWGDRTFRARFLRALYLHGEFVERHIERSEVNGNHYTADAAGLVVAGLVLGVARWADEGWSILCTELPLQVHPDGVDFEGSSAYHRLVGELFALPALLRRAHDLDVPAAYVERIERMAEFTRAYTGPDGDAPLWGDADDGRALPLGGQGPNDHRSFPGLAAALAGGRADGNPEAGWLVGPDAVADAPAAPPTSAAFPSGGVYVLRDGDDHVFVDCGPVGLAGRGGHGHNDCLSFEATLAGTKVIVDSGSYVYTASPEWRNRFRSTAAHNTPLIDGEEQNRLDPRQLWSLASDAMPSVLHHGPASFRGSHSGYERLAQPVTVTRTLTLDPRAHRLTISDELDGAGEHDVAIGLQLAVGAAVEVDLPGTVAITCGTCRFALTWQDPNDWELDLTTGFVSPSYGVKHEAPRLVWRRPGTLRPLRMEIA